MFAVTHNTSKRVVSLNASPQEKDEVYGLKMLHGFITAGVGDMLQLWDVESAKCLTQVQVKAAENGVCFGGRERNPMNRAFIFGMSSCRHATCVALSGMYDDMFHTKIKMID